jgi:hypothetical protein
MNGMRAISAVAALALAAAAPAANLIPDPEFDSGTGNWTASSGTLTLDNSVGSPTAPSAHFVATAQASMTLGCIASSEQNVDIRANARVDAGAFAVGNIWAFASTDCSGGVLGFGNEIFGFVFPGAWATYGGAKTLPAGTQSVRIDFSFSSGQVPGGELHVDHVQFGPEGTAPVTLQSFDVH